MSPFAPTAKRPPIAGLYVLTPELADTALLVARVSCAIAGGAAVVQYRNKLGPAALRREQALALRALCRARSVTFIVNDDVGLAREVAADGVHLGRDDGELAAARRQLRADAIIGASCYDSLEAGQRALLAGASYLAFGSFFASRVKPQAVRAPLSLLSCGEDAVERARCRHRRHHRGERSGADRGRRRRRGGHQRSVRRARHCGRGGGVPRRVCAPLFPRAWRSPDRERTAWAAA